MEPPRRYVLHGNNWGASCTMGPSNFESRQKLCLCETRSRMYKADCRILSGKVVQDEGKNCSRMDRAPDGDAAE